MLVSVRGSSCLPKGLVTPAFIRSNVFMSTCMESWSVNPHQAFEMSLVIFAWTHKFVPSGSSKPSLTGLTVSVQSHRRAENKLSCLFSLCCFIYFVCGKRKTAGLYEMFLYITNNILHVLLFFYILYILSIFSLCISIMWCCSANICNKWQPVTALVESRY